MPKHDVSFAENIDRIWKTFQAKEYLKAISVGIAAAMVRAACKHRSILTQVDPDEAIACFAKFSPSFTNTPETFGVDFVNSIAPVD